MLNSGNTNVPAFHPVCWTERMNFAWSDSYRNCLTRFIEGALESGLKPQSTKELSRNNLIRRKIPRLDFVVPITVELVAADPDLCEFLIGDLDPAG